MLARLTVVVISLFVYLQCIQILNHVVYPKLILYVNDTSILKGFKRGFMVNFKFDGFYHN